MALYRVKETGELKSQGDLRKEHKNTSFPRVWGESVLQMLGIDEVLETPRPTVELGPLQTYQPGSVQQNADGNWERIWEIVDLFSDDETGTKAEKEAAYLAQIEAAAEHQSRMLRNDKLAETDWWALSDVTMTAEQAAYRQALRDITTHANWPHLQEADWPVKPE